MKKAFFLLPPLLVISNLLCAQSWYFRHYQVENGLSNNTVFCCLQDHYGFLWFGTRDGLSRFDGYSFKVFNTDPGNTGSLGNGVIHSLHEDDKGRLWIGTQKGIYEYLPMTETFAVVKELPIADIREMDTDSAGNLWFIAGINLYKYSNDHVLTSYPTKQYFEATSVCVTSNKEVWVATSRGTLEQYNAATNSFTSFNVFSHSPEVSSRWIERIYPSDGTLFIATSTQGAKVFDITSQTYKDIITTNPDHTAIHARDFIKRSLNEYWIATETGIFIYNPGTGNITNLRKQFNDPWSISDNAIYSFAKDKEGGIWSSSYFGGVNYYPTQYNSFEKFYPGDRQNSLSGNVVREIAEDKYGNTWIGTEDGGLNKWDHRTRSFLHFNPGDGKSNIAYSNIHGLLASGDELWIGTYEHGMDVMDVNTNKILRHYEAGEGPHALKSNFIYCLYKTAGAQLLVGTQKGLYSYNRAVNNFDVVPQVPADYFVTSMMEDHAGTVWIGTLRDGIYWYNNKTGQQGRYQYDSLNSNGLATNTINSIFEDSRHTIWVTTERAGLFKLNPDHSTFTRYTTRNGLPSNTVLKILEDARKNLWISTAKGLACFNPEDGTVKTYTRANGLLSDQFNNNAAFKAANGQMYFGSLKGMVSFNPDLFILNTYVPEVYITGFQVFNKELDINHGSPLTRSIIHTDAITLPYNQSTFSIDFAALSYTASEMTEYKYYMDGLKGDWVYLKTNRKVYFTDLSPGTYTFKVIAANSSGIWSNKETQLTIHILSPWWASPIAWVCYALLAIALALFLLHSYHQRTEEKNRRKIELLEHQKEKEVYQAKIDFFTDVAHEIKTPLTLIKGPLEHVITEAGDQPNLKPSLSMMEKYTERLLTLTNQLLDFRTTESKGFSLNHTPVPVSALLQESFTAFKPMAAERQLDYALKLPAEPLTAYADQEALQKIFDNLLSNAVKYADHKVLVTLQLSSTPGYLKATFKSDGTLIPEDMKEKIFEPFVRLKQTQKQKGTGIGLALARSLAELHKGTLTLAPTEAGMNVFMLSLPLEAAAPGLLKTV